MKGSNLRSGEVTLIVLGAIVLLGVGFIALKPLFSGDKRRARESVEATEQLVVAVDAQGASAAAGVVKIGEANTVAPESPSRDFIAREVPVVLSKLPAPDPVALLEAEKRRAAVMEGRAEEASRLYERESKRAEKLQGERDAAVAQRRAVDLELSQVAAARAAAEQQRLILMAVAVLAAGLWVFSWFSRISPVSMGRIAADVRAGENAITALDRHTSPWLHRQIRKHSKLATEPKE